MVRRWWLSWAGAAMFALMLFLGIADMGWRTADACGGGEDPRDLLIGLAAPAALLATAFGMIWAKVWRHLLEQPLRAFALIATLLGGLLFLAVPLLVIVLVAEGSVVSA